MRRKVIQIADSTQLISLPRKWCIANNIQKGDELEVEEKGTQIWVSAKEDGPKVEKITIDTGEYGLFTLRSIAAIYKAGYDEVEIHFKSPENLEQLPKFLNEDLPGFEVFDHAERRYLIKAISKETPEEFDPALRRIFLIAVSMGKSLVEALREPKVDVHKLNNIMAMEITINRLCNFCQRLLNKKGYKQYRKTAFIFTIIWEIEKYCDELKYLAQFARDHPKTKFSAESITLFENATTLFELFYNEFYKFNQTSVGELAQQRKKIISQAFPFLEKGKDATLVHHTITITQMIFNMQGSFMGLLF
jgi:phosphate uptake regulator